ncbi:hypothetical protein D3C80_390860 [compost metagenome]
MHAKMLGNRIDRTQSAWQQHLDDLTYPLRRLVAQVSQLHVQRSLHFAMQRGVRLRYGHIQIAPAANDGVEFLRELDRGSQHTVVYFKAGGRFVSKTDPYRPEGITAQNAQRAEDNSGCLFNRLAPDAMMALHVHPHMQQGQIAHILKPQLHTGVMQSRIAKARLQGGAQCWLFADKQRQHAKVGKVSLFGEQQTESLLTGQSG